MSEEPVLTGTQRAVIDSARRAVLATIGRAGRPRLVPICFSLDPDRPVLYTPVDEKPKLSDDPLALARVRDIGADPRVTVLVDRWDEDWTRLGWLRGEGTAEIVLPGSPGPDGPAHTAAVAALRGRYPQYETHHLEERPLIRIVLEHITEWGTLA
ncbi:MAG TPA: TIGR03668 family PPOX class F420-dependent oxidoreductase [Candidatus Limnocylindrales bacterium]|jgi:PPOX class probable F420-dependent enzyme|nr:TIGR03668 family PPOX class F420-dependent oxidoreductase [Candidatus Limnocylindrales bacterium]